MVSAALREHQLQQVLLTKEKRYGLNRIVVSYK